MPPTPRTTRSCRSAWWRRARWRRPSGRSRSPRGGRAVLPRGGGSSQAGQTVNHVARSSTARSISTSILDLDVAGRRCLVEPGIVLDDLNRAAQAARPVVSGRRLDRLARHHRRHGRQQLLRRALAALRQHARERASRSTRCWPTARKAHFGPVAADLSDLPDTSPLRPLARDLFALGAREADEIAARFPQGAAPGRRLQHRRAGARHATTSTSRTSWSAPKARSASRPRSS